MSTFRRLVLLERALSATIEDVHSLSEEVKRLRSHIRDVAVNTNFACRLAKEALRKTVKTRVKTRKAR